jgi:PHS family inorganic phosphate transporter-like MFS transporter
MMGAVFAMQGFGQLDGALVMLSATAGFKESLLPAATLADCKNDCTVAVDKMWRILVGMESFYISNLAKLILCQLGFGAVPACLSLYYRLTIPETPRYTFDVARDIGKGKGDVSAYMKGKSEGSGDDAARLRAFNSSVALKIPKASWRDFISFYSNWKNGKILLGTAGSWFLLDVAFHVLGLNSSTVLTAINYGKGPNLYVILYNLAAGNCILVCAGAIPGYWTTVALVDTVGRKPIQLMGFIVLTILFIIWGFDFNNLSGTAHLAYFPSLNFSCHLFFLLLMPTTPCIST